MACPSATSLRYDSVSSSRRKRPSPLSGEHPPSISSNSGTTSTAGSIRIPRLVAERRHERGIIDTSVVIDLGRIDPAALPSELAVTAVTLAELAAGTHATADADERARRQDLLQRAETTFEPLPVDRAVARAYGRIYAAVAAAGRKARGSRAFDLLIAATALAGELPLYTRNPRDFRGLERLIDVVAVSPSPHAGI
jgi:predicted nucleic acid-binding protein